MKVNCTHFYNINPTVYINNVTPSSYLLCIL